MPTWPSATVIPPYSVSPFGIIDPVLRFSSDQGYEIRRSRWSRSRRVYQVTYWDSTNLILQIIDFIERELRVGALSFSWTYPYAQSITSISAATPNLLTTTYVHGLQTGDYAVLADTATHDGTYTVTRINANNVQLQGTTGGVAEGAIGTIAAYYPYMSLQLEGDTMQIPEAMHGWGAMVNDDGYIKLNLMFREEFA